MNYKETVYKGYPILHYADGTVGVLSATVAFPNYPEHETYHHNLLDAQRFIDKQIAHNITYIGRIKDIKNYKNLIKLNIDDEYVIYDKVSKNWLGVSEEPPAKILKGTFREFEESDFVKWDRDRGYLTYGNDHLGEILKQIDVINAHLKEFYPGIRQIKISQPRMTNAKLTKMSRGR